MKALASSRRRGGVARAGHRPSWGRASAWALLALVIVGQISCRRKRERPPVVPVTGEVFFEGQPATGATVTFVRIDDPWGASPHGVVDAAGAFRVSTYQLEDGAPSGDYAVTLAWRGPNPRANGEGDEDVSGPDRFAGRYADPQTSPWRVTVGREPVRLDRFEIESNVRSQR